MSDQIFRLEVPNNMTYIPAILAFASKLAEQLGFDRDDTQLIEKALHEAILNIVQQSAELCDQDKIYAEFDPGSAGLSMIIRSIADQTAGDHQSTAVEPWLNDISESNVSGLGFYLTDNAFDAVQLNTLGKGRKEIRLTKHVPIKHISSFRAEEQKWSIPRRQVEMPVHFNPDRVTVRPLEHSEAVQVSYYAFKAFGYVYGEYIYYPSALVEKNINGELISVVAQIPDGDIIGHGALEFPKAGSKTAEVGVVFVRPEYRGLGISARIFDNLQKRAQELGLAGLYSRICTANKAMHKTSVSFGSINCGFWLGAVPRIDAQGQRSLSAMRESLYLGFLPLTSRQPVTIFPPKEDQSMIEKIYAAMQLPVLIKSEDANPAPSGQYSVIHAIMNPHASIAVIEVVEIGADTGSELKQRLNSYLLEQIAVVYLYLDLENPGSAAIARECSQSGYIFAGIIPYGSNRGRDVLVLQYLNDLIIEYDMIHPNSDLAIDTLNYIRDQHKCQPG